MVEEALDVAQVAECPRQPEWVEIRRGLDLPADVGLDTRQQLPGEQRQCADTAEPGLAGESLADQV
jgi:hypothetical protein